VLRRSFRRGLLLGLLVGAGFALTKIVQKRREDTVDFPLPSWEPIPGTTPLRAPVEAPAVAPVVEADPAPAPKPAAKAPARKAARLAPWVDPVEGVCPSTHPVKGKLKSGLFHLPGMFAYPRTNPDRCYQDEAAAEADGLTKAKR
jgi:hypothetical protein